MKNAMQLKAIMKKLAKENQISAQLVLQNYMLERFLERVSLSPYRDNYMGNSLIPFNNPQPKDTKTYKLLTTKPGEME